MGLSTTKPRCKELVLRVLKDNPISEFTASSLAYAIQIKHGHKFSDRTVRKALNELWKAEECESSYGHGPDRFFRKPRHEATPEELAREQECHAAWHVQLDAEWRAEFGEPLPKNMTGPAGLWPDDMKRTGD